MSKSLHHANLLLGTLEEGESHVRLVCENLGVRLANNPDFIAFRNETFGIDEARQLRLLAARKALIDKKIFLITPVHLTQEAQNALLKTFEDPSPDTHFFLVVREEWLVLPTLRSRMQVTDVSTRQDLVQQGLALKVKAERFLALSLKDRLLFAKGFKDEGVSTAAFLDDIMLLLRKREKAEELLKSAYRLRTFANDSSALPRLILEHLSLVL